MPIIQSVNRALKILDLFDEYNKELKITEISEKMMLHKSTVHSLLKTLEKHHYIEQDKESNKYRLGLKLFERGNFVGYTLDIRGLAKEYLHSLAQKTNLTVHLVILDGKEGLYIDKVESHTASILYSRIGRRIPIHCSGVGKALVADKSDKDLESLLTDYEFIKRTENTITEKEEFLQEIELVRQRGYAIDNQENEPGVYCIAVPVRNYSGEVVAAISISSPVMRVTDEQKTKNIELLKQASNELSQKLGYEFNNIKFPYHS
ncbi:IclR family transcriptional regulator [Evansella halocellulosilytica]|uniref:IclR family transcriptional regulator n=1 Tax=Evansella halocellulosilytica TaxID=2011013 RepID=UPI000BB69D2C|nr:IclR family transcriptional regulator [Evansella halocellulosilytica]